MVVISFFCVFFLFKVDFASVGCQKAFFDKMELSGQLRAGNRPAQAPGQALGQAPVKGKSAQVHGHIGTSTGAIIQEKQRSVSTAG